jgi:glucosylglycerate synthase
MFETALRADARRRVRQIGQADIVVGIPSYRNAKTIGKVILATGQGLALSYPQHRCLLINADGGSSDDTSVIAREAHLPAHVKRIATGYQGMAGRGSAVRAILQITQCVEAQVCVLLDADVKNMRPGWIESLVDPILRDGAEYVSPYYARPGSESGVTDLIVHPMTRMLYGTDLRQPVGSEVALSGAFAAHLADKDVWETDVARAGIGVWMSTMAICEGRRMAQVALGAKMQEPRELSSSTEQAFSQTVGTLFRMAHTLRKKWRELREIAPVPILGALPLADPGAPGTTAELLFQEFRAANKRRRRMWQHVMRPDALQAVLQIAASPEPVAFPDDLWARIVCEFIVVYNKGESDPDKVVEALLSLFYARHASYLTETQGMSPEQVETVVRRQAEAFVAARPYMLERWDSYVPWVSGGIDTVAVQ